MAIAVPLTIPSPTAGLNLRDGVAGLQPNEARAMVNFLSDGGIVFPRPGYTESSDGVGSGAVLTMAEWRGPAGSTRIAGGGGEIYDVSGSTASALTSNSYTDDEWQTAIYNGYLFGVNGSDTPWRYNGSTVAATGFTGSGLTLSDLVNVALVRNRLWLCEVDSADVWYGGVGAVTGALTKFQLSQIASGGYCMAIGSWSVDAGDGPDDQVVFIMSTGEAIIYSGDPASTFSIVGKYDMPNPQGRRCLVNIGGQLAVLTRNGLIPLRAAIDGVAFDIQQIGAFGKAAPGIADDVKRYGTNAGWDMAFVSGKVYISVPRSASITRMWVFNTNNGSWSTFNGIPARSMTESGGFLYTGDTAGGYVWKHDGTSDNGANIVSVARPAYVTWPDGARNMAVSGIKISARANGDATGRLGVDVDYVERALTGASVVLADAGATTPWGSAWGSAWSQNDTQVGQPFYGAEGYGRALGPTVEVNGTTSVFEWSATTMLVTPGGYT